MASDKQKLAFIGFWRHIGFYLGIPPAVLNKHFVTPLATGKLFRSTLVPEYRNGCNGQASISAVHILRATAGIWPFSINDNANYAMARRFVGNPVCDRLDIPRMSFITQVKLQYDLLLQQIFPVFGQLYPDHSWSDGYAAYMKRLAYYLSSDGHQSRRSFSCCPSLLPPSLASSSLSRTFDFVELAFLFLRLALEFIIAVFICPTLIGLLVYKVWQASMLG